MEKQEALFSASNSHAFLSFLSLILTAARDIFFGVCDECLDQKG